MLRERAIAEDMARRGLPPPPVSAPVPVPPPPPTGEPVYPPGYVMSCDEADRIVAAASQLTAPRAEEARRAPPPSICCLSSSNCGRGRPYPGMGSKPGSCPRPSSRSVPCCESTHHLTTCLASC
eukprot:2567341-Amphidinium_carterae.1